MAYLAFLKFIPPTYLLARLPRSVAAVGNDALKCPLKMLPISELYGPFFTSLNEGSSRWTLSMSFNVSTPFSRCSNTYTDWSSEAPLNHCRAIRFSSLGSEHFSNNPFCSLAESSIFVPSGSQHNIHCEGVNELPKSHYS